MREPQTLRHIDVHELKLERVLDSASKLSIDPYHIRDLRREGWRVASEWVGALGARSPPMPGYQPRAVLALP